MFVFCTSITNMVPIARIISCDTPIVISHGAPWWQESLLDNTRIWVFKSGKSNSMAKKHVSNESVNFVWSCDRRLLVADICSLIKPTAGKIEFISYPNPHSDVMLSSHTHFFYVGCNYSSMPWLQQWLSARMQYFPLLIHWRYCSLKLNHQHYDPCVCRYPNTTWF